MQPTHANMMFPGIGVGGYCLTKIQLWRVGRPRIFRGGWTPSSLRAVEINDSMPLSAFEFAMSCLGGSVAGRRIGLLGVAYGQVWNTRFSLLSSL